MITVKKIKQEENNMKSLMFDLEGYIYTHVRENYPNSWDEDTITRSLLITIKDSLNKKKIYLPGSSIRTSWSVYSHMNEPDNIICDFAIAARIIYHDNYSVEGVALFDAKTRDPDKNTFSAIKVNNLKKIRSVSPYSQLILYDYDSITGMAFPTSAESIVGNYPHSWNNWLPATNAASVPVTLATELNVKNTGLYKVSLPFSYLLAYRYPFGLDLDFQKSALDICKGFKTDRGNPRYLVTLTVAHGGTDLQDDIEYNEDNYIAIE